MQVLFLVLLAAVVVTTAGPLTARLAGWSALAGLYPAPGPFEGRKWTASGAMGLAHYGFSLWVGADARGLSLEAAPWVRSGHRPLFIPWDAMTCRAQDGPFYPRVLVGFKGAPGVVLRLHRSSVLELKEQAGTPRAFPEIS